MPPMLSLLVIIKLKVFYLQVMNATNAEPAGDNQTESVLSAGDECHQC